MGLVITDRTNAEITIVYLFMRYRIEEAVKVILDYADDRAQPKVENIDATMHDAERYRRLRRDGINIGSLQLKGFDLDKHVDRLPGSGIKP